MSIKKVLKRSKGASKSVFGHGEPKLILWKAQPEGLESDI